MSFIPQATAQTINSGSDLQITDTSTYPIALGSISKTALTGRTILLVRYDGISQSINFPYTNANDFIQDTLVVPGYFNTPYGPQRTIDMILSITVNYIYMPVNGIPVNIAYAFVYQSKINILYSLANMAIVTYLSSGDTEQYSGDPNKYDSYRNNMKNIINCVESSKAKIQIGDLITAQKLLLAAYNMCPPSCNEC